MKGIEKIEREREQRRAQMKAQQQSKAERNAANKQAGKCNTDADFEIMIDGQKNKVGAALNHVSATQMAICINVRKRPLFDKEFKKGEMDAVSASNPKIVVHEPKFKVDGITKYIQDTNFEFDNTFNENENSQDMYQFSIRDLLPSIFQNGIVTCFAYGQTGSGKTFTVNAITKMAINDLFKISGNKEGVDYFMSMFEIYGGKCMDLLNNKKKLQILEDKNNKIQIFGLEEKQAYSAADVQQIIDYGHSIRTTHQTAANDTSSRSHAICQINIKINGREQGKLLLVDLAGSERAADCQSNNRQRRLEGAEINKSLLALKECIRAMDSKHNHIPFRASKLTMVLRDSFMSSQASKIVMIACVNPGSSSSDHTVNTLRYAQRLKCEKENNQYKNPNALGFLPQHQQNNVVQDIQPTPQQVNNVPQPVAAPMNPMQQPMQQQQQQHEPQQQQRRNDSGDKYQGGIGRGVGQKAGAQKEERKRAGWGNQNGAGSRSELQVNGQGQGVKAPVGGGAPGGGMGQNRIPPSNKQNMQKRPSGVDVARPQNDGMADIMSPDNKKKKKDDWNYLKQTLKSNNNMMGGAQEDGVGALDPNLLTFHEKADQLVEEEEELRNQHLEYLKEAAKLLTEEGELISNVQGFGSEEYDMDEYVVRMEKIIKRNLEIYGDLQQRIGAFKTHMKEEEEAHQQVRGTFYF